MKYIMIETEERKFPIIFPNELVHKHMAMLAVRLLAVSGYPDAKVVSAGEVSVEVTCFGKSVTLQCEADPIDSDIINTIDVVHGIKDVIGTPVWDNLIRVLKERPR